MWYRFLGLCLLGFAICSQGVAQVSRYNPAEKGWLADHQNLRAGVVEMTPPILYLERSHSKGLVPDYLRALADKLGLQLQIRYYQDPDALLQALREGEVDMIGAAVQTHLSPPDLHFTRPYLNLPAAIFTTNRIADKELNALDGLEVSVVAGSIWEEGIPHLLPTLNVMAFNDLGQALQAVIADRAQAYLGDAASVKHLLSTTETYDGLKEMMRLDMTVDVAVATLYSEPVLQSLLQKGLDRLSREDMHDIWYHWQDVESPVKQGNNLAIYIVGGLFLMLWSLLLAWAVRLHSQKALAHHRSKTKRSIKRLRRRENLLKQKLMSLKNKTKRYRYRAKSLRQQVDFLGEVLPSSSWSWDPSDANCHWDDEMYLMAGQKRGQFTPAPASILDLIHEQDRKRVAQLFESDNTSEMRITYRLLLPAGGERRVLDYSHYVPAEDTGPGKRVGICWDVDNYFRSAGDLLLIAGKNDASKALDSSD
ncbi:MAG: transporter substrate-binding domain-containing protein [Candidatus Thiodiazotropha sp.]